MKLNRLSVLMAGTVLIVSASYAQQRDYTPLFAKFHSLGLPDVTGATYVKLTMFSGGHFNPMGNLHELRLSGNAWLIEENKEGVSRVVPDNCTIVDVWDNQLLTKERQKKTKEIMEKNKNSIAAQMRVSFLYQNDGKKGAQWQKADLAGDVKKAVAYMKKQKDAPRDRSWAFRSGGYGTMFLFAVHISKHGYKAEANEIIQMLFDHAADRRKVILQVINSLANAAYGKTYEAFRETSDWQALDKELSALLTRFSMGWRAAPAIKRLSAAIKKRIAQPKPPPITGEGLTDEDITLGRELTTTTNRYMANVIFRPIAGNLWILTPAEIPEGTKPEDIHVIDRIKARGVKSLPLLLALVKDEYLTEMDLMESRGHGYSQFRNFYSHDDQPMNEQMIRQMYNQMARPASRADIAAQLLQTVPLQDPRGRRNLDPSDHEALYQECKDWYDQHGKKTPVELARLYMEKGGHGQRDAGMQVLVKIGTEDDMAAIEERFLNSQRASADTWQVQQYVRTRGDKAKAFVDKYEAAIKQRMTSTDDQLFKHDGMKKQMENALKMLRDIVDAEPAAKMIEEILAGTRKFSESQQSLRQRLSSEKPEDILTMMLDAAAKAKTPTVARDFLQWAGQARYMRQMTEAQFGFVTSVDPMAQQAKLDPKTHAEQWKKLLADDRKPAPGAYYGRRTATTLGATAAWTIDTLYRDHTVAGMYAGQNHYQLGHRLSDLMKRRALARLEGKADADLPEFPSADNLTPDQKTNLVARLMAAPDTGIGEAVDGLSLDEMLVLMAEAVNNTNLNVKLAPKAMIVKDIHETPETGTHLKSCKEMTGKRLTKAMVRKIVDTCRDLASGGKILTCSIARLPCLDGINVELRELDKDSDEYQSMTRYNRFGRRGGTREGTLSVTIGAVGANAHAIWPLPAADAEAVPAEKKDEDDLVFDEIAAELDKETAATLELTHADFWENLDKYLAGAGNVCQAGAISIFGLPVIEDEEEKK